uniref:Uncharacterized protein n=1 Tax=Tanacetum cinerariifolium TaxID=118510 RepID=A0A699JTF3_TANCI|nr:hypothetical protein [Tanacetum cinerariifolium]
MWTTCINHEELWLLSLTSVSQEDCAFQIDNSKRVIKKKVTIFIDDNIIPDLDVALELGKSISLTEAIEKEVTMQVHVTHERIVTEYVPEPTKRRPSGNSFRDTSSVTKKMYFDPSQKLKGVQTFIPEEQLAADTMQALKIMDQNKRENSLKKMMMMKRLNGWSLMKRKRRMMTLMTKIDDEFIHGDEQVNDDDDEKMTNTEEAGTRNGDAKDVQELKEANNTTTLGASLESKIPPAVNAYLRSSMGDAHHKKALEETPLLVTQSSSQAQSSLKAAESLSEYELKMILFDKIDKSCSYLTHDKHQSLFDNFLNSMSLDDAIVSGQADPEKFLRKRDHDDENPLAGPNHVELKRILNS